MLAVPIDQQAFLSHQRSIRCSVQSILDTERYSSFLHVDRSFYINSLPPASCTHWYRDCRALSLAHWYETNHTPYQTAQVTHFREGPDGGLTFLNNLFFLKKFEMALCNWFRTVGNASRYSTRRWMYHQLRIWYFIWPTYQGKFARPISQLRIRNWGPKRFW